MEDDTDAPNSGGSKAGGTDASSRGQSSPAALPRFAAFAADGGRVPALQTAAAAHDTTGGVATKIREAAAVARLGAEVRIAAAGGPSAPAACLPAPLPARWVGTVVRLRESG